MKKEIKENKEVFRIIFPETKSITRRHSEDDFCRVIGIVNGKVKTVDFALRFSSPQEIIERYF